MCLYSKIFITKNERNKAAKNPIVAKRSFTVYKRLSRGWRGKGFRSPFRGFEWQRGFHYFQDAEKLGEKFRISYRGSKYSYQFRVDMGLHCWKTKKAARGKSGRILVQMTIPKGALYFEGIAGDIVTDQLIFPYAKSKTVGNPSTNNK